MADINEPKMQEVPDDSEEFELGHTDKLVGVFTSPSETFRKISNFPPKIIDWFLPMLLVILVSVFAGFVKMSNPAISVEQMQKQREAQSKVFDAYVSQGKMTREQADQQLDAAAGMMDSPVMKIISVVGGLIFGFIIFFIMAGIYYLYARFALKGSGTYGYVLVSYGLASYLLILQTILATIFSLMTSKFLSGFSVAALGGFDKKTILGFVLSFLDPISIWFYLVFGIALAKTFKSDNAKKYIIAIFAFWIGLWTLFFILSKYVPIFENFIQ